MDKELMIGMDKTPETEVNKPVDSGTTFKDLVNSAPPAKREKLTRDVAQLMTEGFEHLTTGNGDGTFTHEFVTPDKNWPNVVE